MAFLLITILWRNYRFTKAAQVLLLFLPKFATNF